MSDNIRQPIGTRLTELGEKIEQENDPDRRYMFLLFQDLSAILYDIHKEIKESRNDNHGKIDALEKKIDDVGDEVDRHTRINDNNKMSVLWIKWIFSALQGFMFAAAVYSYSLIADLRDTVKEQAVVLPRLEATINDIKQTKKAD